jgi:hypothetical protein
VEYVRAGGSEAFDGRSVVVRAAPQSGGGALYSSVSSGMYNRALAPVSARLYTSSDHLPNMYSSLRSSVVSDNVVGRRTLVVGEAPAGGAGDAGAQKP